MARLAAWRLPLGVGPLIVALTFASGAMIPRVANAGCEWRNYDPACNWCFPEPPYDCLWDTCR